MSSLTDVDPEVARASVRCARHDARSETVRSSLRSSDVWPYVLSPGPRSTLGPWHTLIEADDLSAHSCCCSLPQCQGPGLVRVSMSQHSLGLHTPAGLHTLASSFEPHLRADDAQIPTSNLFHEFGSKLPTVSWTPPPGNPTGTLK